MSAEPAPAIRNQSARIREKREAKRRDAEAMTPLRIASISESYIRDDFIDAGGFGAVFRCYADSDVAKRTPLAVKVVSKAFLDKNAQYRAKFESEVANQFSLNHPNICKLKSHFSDSKNEYLILEYCGGGTLDNVVRNRKSGGLSLPEVRFFIFQLLQALSHLKQNGIVHRDLKLQNVLLDTDMNVKLADFGLCARISSSSQRRKTFCGTPNYIAPEVLGTYCASSRRREKPIPKRAREEGHLIPEVCQGHSFSVDMWSLGVMAYRLICNRQPFNGKDIPDTYMHVLSGRFDWPSSISSMSEKWADARSFVNHCLCKVPMERMTVEEALKHPFLAPSLIPVRLPVSIFAKEPSETDLSFRQNAGNNGRRLNLSLNFRQSAPVAVEKPAMGASQPLTPRERTGVSSQNRGLQAQNSSRLFSETGERASFMPSTNVPSVAFLWTSNMDSARGSAAPSRPISASHSRNVSLAGSQQLPIVSQAPPLALDEKLQNLITQPEYSLEPTPKTQTVGGTDGSVSGEKDSRSIRRSDSYARFHPLAQSNTDNEVCSSGQLLKNRLAEIPSEAGSGDYHGKYSSRGIYQNSALPYTPRDSRPSSSRRFPGSEVAPPEIRVIAWADLSQSNSSKVEYGWTYQLSNGSVGICHKDERRIIILGNGKWCQYYHSTRADPVTLPVVDLNRFSVDERYRPFRSAIRTAHNVFTIYREKSEREPDQALLQNSIQAFVQRNENLVFVKNYRMFTDEYTSYGVKKNNRSNGTASGCAMWLSNRTGQINFSDHSKVVLHVESDIFGFIPSTGGEYLGYMLSSLRSMRATSIERRMQAFKSETEGLLNS